MFDWSDPNTFWLNITDIALGAVTLACLAVVVYAALREAFARVKLRQDSHAFAVPELGMTMADGGEPVNPSTKPDKK
jgi:hypothetical protein